MTRSYDEIGVGYNSRRLPDERIGRQIEEALGQGDSLANVGAGTGAYEPGDRQVVAIDPSTEMLTNYLGRGVRIRGAAAALPLSDDSVDAASAFLTMHHWGGWRDGLAEMSRVARHRIVIFTHDPDMDGFWLFRYFPAISVLDQDIFEPIDHLLAAGEELGWRSRAVPVEVPFDCTDGFLGAYWRRPASYLEADVRRSISSFNLIDPEEVAAGLDQLASDLESGAWMRENGDLLAKEQLDIGYRLVLMSRD